MNWRVTKTRIRKCGSNGLYYPEYKIVYFGVFSSGWLEIYHEGYRWRRHLDQAQNIIDKFLSGEIDGSNSKDTIYNYPEEKHYANN